MLGWVCKSQRHVGGSTFAAEFLSVGDAADQGLLLAQQLREMLSGPIDAVTARITVGFVVPLVLIVGAMPVFAAVIATFIQTPAE